MAKIRRIVRKVAHASGDYFDEKIWPVYIALVVLGAFLMGVSAAYLSFSGVPWYANAITSLVAIPIVVAAFMVAFRFIDNRLVRRSMQLAVVVSAIVHLLMVVQMIETQIFSGWEDEIVAEREVIEPRRRRLMPEYQALQMLPEEERPKQDFEKPLETRTPEPQPEPENFVRQETQADMPQAIEQPVPAPEPTATAEPNVVRRRQPNEVAPRAAENTSRLSRQSKPSELTISQLAQSLPIEQPQPQGMAAKAAASRVERQSVEPTPATASAIEAQAAPAAAPRSQVARQDATSAPQVDPQPAPTLKRQVAEPTRTPTSPIAAADSPPQPKATSPEAVAPASTFTQRQATASPPVVRTEAPLPEIASSVSAPLERRQSPAETAPQVAQSPSPVANRQPRTTTRPDVSATAAAEPVPTATASAARTEPVAPASRVERTAAAVSSPVPSPTPSVEPAANATPIATARPTRMEGREAPAASPSPSAIATRSRQTGAPSVASAAEVQPAATGAVPSSAMAEIAPNSTATRRQATEAPQASPSAGEPTASQLAALAPQTTASPAQPRRATGTGRELPTMGPSGAATPSPSRSTTSAVANVVTRVGDVTTNAGPQPSESAAVGPSATSVTRQSAGTASVNAATSATAQAPGAPQAVALAAGGMTRAQSSQTPSMRPQVAAGNSPARAAASAPAAASPAAIDSPAAQVAASGTETAPQPPRLAVSRSQAGMAGVGQSPNVDRAAPGSESPALMASGSARRAESTSQTPGDALTPTSAAQLARSTAGEVRPVASIRAEMAEVGNLPSAAEVAPQAASSSATLARADAQASRAEITGAKGSTDVDLGPTQLVAERGGNRAAGGGQPQPRLELSAAHVARSESAGGLPQVSLAGAQVAENVAAPEGDTGGAPATLEAQVAGLAKATATATATGGNPAESEQGPSGAATAAQLLARTEMSRAQAEDGAAGGGIAGADDLEDEEEKARRLARASQGGAPQLAVAGPVIADAVASPMGDSGAAGAATLPETLPAATTTSRMTASGGAPAGGAAAPAAEPGAAAAEGGASAPAAVAIARAEAADGTPGAPLIGGGSQSPIKASSAPTFAADTAAESIQLAGAPESTGDRTGVALAARGTQTERMAGGASGPVASQPQGALAGDEAILATAPVAAQGERRAAGGAEGPQVADAATGSPLARAGAAGAPASSAIVAEIPEVGPGSAVAQAELDHNMGGMGTTPMTRQSGEGIAVNIEAPAGPGGLGNEYSPEVGVNSRRAREESLTIQTAATRFVRSEVGGLPAVSTTAIVSREPFAKRSGRLMGDQPGSGRGASSPETEAAIEMGLEFLARHQHPDGHWSLQGFDDATAAVSEDERRFLLISDTGATALSILAFQGGGYTHREHKYKEVLHRGIAHLLAYQKENGDLFVPLDDRSNQSVWLYSHALATLALCEAYGMTQDPSLKEPAQKAIDFIVASQNKDLGGWRYSPGIGSDTSVTGWMIAALYSGRLAGLNVPSETFARIDTWMTSAQGSAGDAHLYRYNPYAPDTPQQRHGRVASKTMTAVGLLSRVFLGWKHDHAGFARGAEFLRDNLPAIGTQREPQRDTYYWYYATLTLVYLKERNPSFEPAWRDWERTLFPLLRESQEKEGPWAGSWNPRGPVPDRWALHAGRLYVTTMNLLSLEANYRYLPVHTAVQGQSGNAAAGGRGIP